MIQMTYVDANGRLIGLTALVRPSPNGPGYVLAQFDHACDRGDGVNLAFGWHEFARSEFTSNLNCIQELVPKDRHYPWRVLVVCALLNQTHGRGVRPMVDEFFVRVPDPEAMMVVHKAAIEDLLRPLGFHNRRFVTLCKMTADYLKGLPYRAIYGVGPYALDSLDLFVNGLTDMREPADMWLRPYLAWRRDGGPPVEWNRAGHDEWRRKLG